MVTTNLQVFFHEQIAAFRAIAKEAKRMIDEIRRDLVANAAFVPLSKEKQKKLLAGEQVYVDGLRGAARPAGWDIDEFNAIYTYYFAYAHGSPVSYLGIAEHGVDYVTPTAHQFAVAGHALEVAGMSLDIATRRIRRVFLPLMMEPRR